MKRIFKTELDASIDTYLVKNQLIQSKEATSNKTRGAYVKFRQSIGRYALQRLFIAWLEFDNIGQNGQEAFAEKMRPLVLDEGERRTQDDHGGHRRAATEEDKRNAKIRFRGTFLKRVAALPWS